MARKINKSLGFVRLKQLRTGMWQIQYRDHGTGKYLRRRFPADSYEEALRLAKYQNDAIKEERGLFPKIRQSSEALASKSGPTVKEAMLECINASRASKRTKHDYVSCTNIFLKWLPGRFHEVKLWRDLRPLHLNEFIKHLEKQRKSHATIRLYVLQAKSTARYMSLNYADKGFCDIGVTVKIPKPSPQIVPQVLEAEDLAAYLAFLKENQKPLLPVIMLQGLCGLRIREALALREQDVDFDKETIDITDTPVHTPKTASSYRTIPIPQMVLETLKSHVARMKVRHPEGYLFLSKLAEPWTDNGYRQRIQREMRSCRHDEIPKALRGFPLRKLRATFSTLAFLLGAEDRILKRYLGHSSKDILGTHYLRIDIEDLRQVSTLFDGDWIELSRDKRYPHCNRIATGQ